MYKEDILNRMKFSLIIVIFGITIFVSLLFKPSINYIDAQTLAKDIVGVGEIKSEKIINERDKFGFFKGEEDFYNRTRELGIGEVVFNKIKKQYRLDG